MASCRFLGKFIPEAPVDPVRARTSRCVVPFRALAFFLGVKRAESREKASEDLRMITLGCASSSEHWFVSDVVLFHSSVHLFCTAYVSPCQACNLTLPAQAGAYVLNEGLRQP